MQSDFNRLEDCLHALETLNDRVERQNAHGEELGGSWFPSFSSTVIVATVKFNENTRKYEVYQRQRDKSMRKTIAEDKPEVIQQLQSDVFNGP